MWWWFACSLPPETRLERGLAEANPALAVVDLGAASDAGLAQGCDAAGALAVPGTPFGRYDETACKAAFPAACMRLSTAPDDAMALEACKLGLVDACVEAASAGNVSAGVTACEHGHAPSCLSAGDRFRREGDLSAAGRLYGLRCAALGPEDTACLLQARVSGTQPPQAEQPWPEGNAADVAAALWARCEADDAWGCLQLATHLGAGGPLPDSRLGPKLTVEWLWHQACDLQLVYACAPHR